MFFAVVVAAGHGGSGGSVGMCICLDQLDEDIRFSWVYFYFSRPRILNLTK